MASESSSPTVPQLKHPSSNMTDECNPDLTNVTDGQADNEGGYPDTGPDSFTNYGVSPVSKPDN